MRQLGIVVVAAKFGMDTRTKEGLLMAQQTLAMAQWDNQNRTDKFVTGRIDCLKSGAWIEKAPRGYYKEGKSRETFCYLNEEGKVIAQAFKWKLQGLSNSEILNKMTACGLKICKQELHKILVNPFYAGKIKHIRLGAELIDGQIEPAVSYSDFLRVQDILSGKTGRYTHTVNIECPLTKHIICYYDNTPFTSYTKTKKTKTHDLTFNYYKCNKAGCKTNVSAKEMHEKYKATLFSNDISEEVLEQFEDIIKKSVEAYGNEANSRSIQLKKHISELDNQIKNIKLRYATGKIDTDIYNTAIGEFEGRKDTLTLELEKWQGDLSNLYDKIPQIVKIASSLSSMWDMADLDTKRKIQDLVYPHGIYWDKEIRNYRTLEKNSVFAILDKYRDYFYKKTEGENSSSVPLCGRRDSKSEIS